MSRIMTRRHISLRSKPEEPLVMAPTMKKKVTKSKRNLLEESQNNNSNINSNVRKSKRLVKKLRTPTKMDVSYKENKLKPTETTKKFFRHLDPKSDLERAYAKSTVLAGLCKPQAKPRVTKNVKAKNKLRQLSLKESLSNQEQKRTLRPRQDQKDYCENSNLISEHLTPDKQQSIVLVEKLNIENKKKLPVYKSVKSPNDSAKNNADIYDFKFEDSDPKGKLVKKKRRRVIKRQGPKKQIKKGTKEKPPEKYTNNNEKEHEVDNNELIDEAAIANTNDDGQNFVPLISENNNKEVKSKVDVRMKRGVLTERQNVTNDQVIKNIVKPKIISVTDLENRKITLVNSPEANNENVKNLPQKTVDNKTLQYKNMINDTLLNKSLSPIKKSILTFDPSSPWRAPTLHTFSQVKNLYQSTPRLNAASALCKRLLKPKGNTRNEQQEAKTQIIDKINESSYTQPVVNEENFSKKNSLTSPRKFGTVITNVNQFNTNNVLSANKNNVSQSTINNLHADNTLGEKKKLSDSILASNVQSSDLSNSFHLPSVATFNENFEDKENSAPNFQSPKKKSPKKRVIPFSPLPKENVSKTIFDKENTIPDAQPGPSGLQTEKLLDNQTILKQSNLNSFLNLTEMPESTRISTKHGIFDDAHSTPITSKVSRKIHKDEPNVENAFGFNDDSDLDVSPIQINESSNDRKKPQVKNEMNKPPDMVAPTRLSVGQIKHHLFPRKTKKVENKEKEPQLTVKNIKERENRTEQKKTAIDAISFSDTFDMLSETGELPKDLPDPPLFVDLEPSHFTQPPRRSYKRKRNVKFSFSEDENESEIDEEETHKIEHKKRKVGKLNKEEEKRLQQWVKNVNETFEEIDHHDLVVE